MKKRFQHSLFTWEANLRKIFLIWTKFIELEMSSLKSTKDIDEIESEKKVNNHALKTQLHE